MFALEGIELERRVDAGDVFVERGSSSKYSF